MNDVAFDLMRTKIQKILDTPENGADKSPSRSRSTDVG